MEVAHSPGSLDAVSDLPDVRLSPVASADETRSELMLINSIPHEHLELASRWTLVRNVQQVQFRYCIIVCVCIREYKYIGFYSQEGSHSSILLHVPDLISHLRYFIADAKESSCIYLQSPSKPVKTSFVADIPNFGRQTYLRAGAIWHGSDGFWSNTW